MPVLWQNYARCFDPDRVKAQMIRRDQPELDPHIIAVEGIAASGSMDMSVIAAADLVPEQYFDDLRRELLTIHRRIVQEHHLLLRDVPGGLNGSLQPSRLPGQ